MMTSTAKTVILVVQLVGTFGIMFFIENTLIALCMMLILWFVTFFPFTKQEIVVFMMTCFFYTLGDIVVLNQGIFYFSDQDILGMPYYEPFMWGFYFLHTMRMLGGSASQRALHGLLFSLIVVATLVYFTNTELVSLLLIAIVLGGLLVFKTQKDFEYVFYLFGIGIILEFAGTYFGEWVYTIDDYLLWWIATWALSGLILYRAILPMSTWVVAQSQKRK